ncbi:MAG TPA: DUF6084 family protein [Bryobacteraceae bacterium]|nr:DUF6084 family protein [Bryobacteraceae bacterium]
MPGLTFSVESAEAIPFAAAPTIAFRLRVVNPNASHAIQSVALRCQILIEASRRHYQAGERENLRDLFGEPDRWSQTLRSLLWTHASVTVPSFSGTVACELGVPCTFDFNVGAAKYFHAIQAEDVPLCFQFSGTIFYETADGTLQIDQIDWNKEARFRLPSKIWREMMDHYYPNSAWLRLRRDAFERLYEYKRRRGIATWEEAIESLLPLEKEAAS